MKKLRLNLDDLAVSSFRTGHDGSGGRTVKAHDYTAECPGYTCTNGHSTCEFPTAVNHTCAPGWTDGDQSCWVAQPRTYYCYTTPDGGGSAPYAC